MKKILSLIIVLFILVSLSACKGSNELDLSKKYEGAYIINLNKDSATLDGKEIEEFDYTWNFDPTTVHEDDENAPAEYYSGTKPETDSAVYIDHELYYYPYIDESKFQSVRYDGENEYVYYYEDGVNNDYIVSTLPHFNNSNTVPTNMMHTKEEALNNKVLHITKEGTYVLTGDFNGQVYVDLGDKDETFTDENAKVTIILYNANITCTVAPALVFYSLYECDNAWEERDEKLNEVDTTNAGANLIIADGTSNTIDGQNIYRMLKTKYKDDDSKDEIKVQKKLRKIDSALYSYVSMNVNGEDENTGTLIVNSSFEGLDTELHLTFLGGNITINSMDDGINVNEDDVSVVSFLGGNIVVNAANGAEGDGIDSNGSVVIDGANLCINNIRVPDDAVDSGVKILYKSGTLTIDGEERDLEYGEYNSIGNSKFNGGFDPNNISIDIDIKDFKEKVAALSDDATIEDVLEILGLNNFGPRGGFGDMPQGEPPEMPQGQEPNMPQGEPPEIPQGQEPNVPQGEPPEKPEGEKMNIPQDAFRTNIDFNVVKFKELVAALDEDTTIGEIMDILGMNREVPKN